MLTMKISLLTYRNTLSQRRFRSAIQKFGWDLVNDQIVSPDGCTGGEEGTAATPVKKGRGKKSPAKKVANDESPVKKRKLSDSVVDSASEEDVKQEDEAKVNGGSEGAEAKANGEAAAED